MKCKIALIQMHVACGRKDENLKHAEALIHEAAANGADIALLPEAMDVGWTQPASQTDAEPIPDGEPCKRLMKTAAKHGIYVCSGLTEKAGAQIFNSAVIIDKHGHVLCTHRKLNELAIGHQYYEQGDRLNVAHTELGTIGLMICADGNAKDLVLSRSLCYMGADFILSPSAWAVAVDHDNTKEPYGDTWRNAYIPVAKEFEVWIAGVSNVGAVAEGPWAGQKCIGCSLVVGPGGKEILQGPYGADAEKILYVDIEPVKRPARGGGWTKYWQTKTANNTISGGTE